MPSRPLQKSDKTVDVNCKYCNKVFLLWKKLEVGVNFCSKECYELYRLNAYSFYTNCSNCNKSIKKQKSELNGNKSGNLFCSRSCAAIFNNKVSPKRQVMGKCCKCGIAIKSCLKHCENCNTFINLSNSSLGEFVYSNHHKSSAFAKVRSNARSFAIKNLNCDQCWACGYNKHVEVCHIKPICEFDLDTLIKDINNEDNLLILCPNCHWEFDCGILKIEIGETGVEPACVHYAFKPVETAGDTLPSCEAIIGGI